MAPARKMIKLGVSSSSKLPINAPLDTEIRELKAIDSSNGSGDSDDLDEDIEIEENEEL